MYPTMVVALIAWFASLFMDGTDLSGNPRLGYFFMLVFFLNMLVFAFDFSRIKSLTIFFVAIAIAFALMWANTQWGIMGWLSDLFAKINIRMNTQFYGFMAVFMSLIFGIVFLNTRFNYFEVNRNEILHHHGYLGDIQRTPTTGMRMQKEIYDLMEFALLKSGRLIFYPQTVREAIVIDNVFGINRVEGRIKHLLSSVSVAIRPDDGASFPT